MEEHKEKILVIVSTSFQLIVAVQLVITKFQNSKVDLIISDYTFDYIEIAERVRKSHIFNIVYTAQLKKKFYSHLE